LDKDGYGRATDFRILRAGRHAWPVGAHVLAWEFAHGRPVPKGLCVCHTCDNRLCCNPAHLWLGTNVENIADRDAKGRQARGDRHWTRKRPRRVSPPPVRRARLTEAQVRDILERLAAGETQTALAREFKVDQTTLSDIERGKTWAHLRTNAETGRRLHGNARLTDAEVGEIRARLAAGEGQMRIAKELGTSQAMVSRIKRGIGAYRTAEPASDDPHLS
jgi:transcriptional regulator